VKQIRAPRALPGLSELLDEQRLVFGEELLAHAQRRPSRDAPKPRGDKGGVRTRIAEDIEDPGSCRHARHFERLVNPGAKLLLLVEFLKRARPSDMAVGIGRGDIGRLRAKPGRDDQHALSKRPGARQCFAALQAPMDGSPQVVGSTPPYGTSMPESGRLYGQIDRGS